MPSLDRLRQAIAARGIPPASTWTTLQDHGRAAGLHRCLHRTLIVHTHLPYQPEGRAKSNASSALCASSFWPHSIPGPLSTEQPATSARWHWLDTVYHRRREHSSLQATPLLRCSADIEQSASFRQPPIYILGVCSSIAWTAGALGDSTFLLKNRFQRPRKSIWPASVPPDPLDLTQLDIDGVASRKVRLVDGIANGMPPYPGKSRGSSHVTFKNSSATAQTPNNSPPSPESVKTRLIVPASRRGPAQWRASRAEVSPPCTRKKKRPPPPTASLYKILYALSIHSALDLPADCVELTRNQGGISVQTSCADGLRYQVRSNQSEEKAASDSRSMA